jgi:hypothetical protein
MEATPAQRQAILAMQRDERLVKRANEYKKGLLTDQDYCDQVVEITLEWLVKEGSH